MRLRLRRPAAALALLVVGAASAAAQPSDPQLCADPSDRCAPLITPACLQRFGAGPLPAEPADLGADCAGEVAAYRGCLGDVIRACGRAGDDDGGEGCSETSALALWRDLKESADTEALEVFADLCAAHPQSRFAALRARRLRGAEPAEGDFEEPPAVVDRGPSPETFRDCEGCPAMIDLAGGSFLMGSPPEEAERRASEGPQRRVEVAAFALAAREVSFAEWELCVAEGGCGGYAPDDGGWGRSERPVIHVSHEDAQRFVSWLSDRTGVAYRLPTEAEWEYAARAGSDAPFGFGPRLAGDRANFNGRRPYGGASPGAFLGRTAPVASYAANAFGLFDMHGNVAEWTSDCWRADHTGPRAPAAREGCDQAATRGGAWRHGAASLRSAARTAAWRDQRSDDLGFRVARPAR